jgi:molybdate transport system ATP-binding protein
MLDEPLSALDSQRKAEILPYLERLAGEGRVPMLYVSHAVSEVARLASAIIVLQDGQVSLRGPLRDVLSDPAAVTLLGVREAGAVLTGQVLGYDPQDGLTEVGLDQGRLLLPGRFGVMGTSVRIRVPAQDVILSLTAPVGMSALNVLAVTVSSLAAGTGPGVAVGLACGRDRLLARITRRSAVAMGLVEGMQVYAILKATAVGQQDIGGGGSAGR